MNSPRSILKKQVSFGGDEMPHRKAPRSKPPPEKSTYIVRIKTGTDPGAGTDANLYVQLFGRNGKVSQTIKCADRTGARFEKGKVDEFKAKLTHIGDLSKLRIWHDNTGDHASWQCKSVQVDDETLCRRYHFHGPFWLSSKIGDCQIQREIPASGRSVLHHCYSSGYRDSQSDTSAREMSEALTNDIVAVKKSKSQSQKEPTSQSQSSIANSTQSEM